MDRPPSKDASRKGRFLREQVYNNLKDAILNFVIEPNRRLIEEQIAAEMGTSRTPVREAIQRLEKDGLIHKRTKTGYAVNVITEEEVEEVFGLRSVLEGYAAHLATLRATDAEIRTMEEIVKKQEVCLKEKAMDAMVQLNTEFHDLLYQGARSAKLHTIINDLRDYIYRYRILMFRYEDMVDLALQEHKELIGLMKARKARQVEKLVRNHIVRGMSLIKKKIRQEARKRERR
jgi:DNA-binding GntR family transcriptional regulator